MKQNKEAKISYWAAHLTTTVSVTLVLIIIGVITLLTLSGARETRRLREMLEINVIMADSVSDASADSLANIIKGEPYCSTVKVITRKQALENWKETTGEDLEELFGVNPLSPEVSLTLRADYATERAITKIDSQLRRMPGVEEVATPESELVDTMDDGIRRLSAILGVIGIVMIVISFVLINNTVHLSIYSRRFTIHTMQLVGATNGFIRRPFILNNMLAGLVAALLTDGFMALALVFAPKAGFSDITTYVSWTDYGVVAAGVVVVGVLLCGLAAWIATSRYLGKDYDELFK